MAMNGTDLPTLNMYGHCGEPPCESLGVYSCPRDLEAIKRRIEDVEECRGELTTTMAEQGFVLSAESRLVPVHAHRYLVCTPSLDSSVVLFIPDGNDAIIYGKSLHDYLEKEFL